MHDDYDLRQEQLNKASLLSSKKFLENLLEKFNSHVVSCTTLSFMGNAIQRFSRSAVWTCFVTKLILQMRIVSSLTLVTKYLRILLANIATEDC